MVYLNMNKRIINIMNKNILKLKNKTILIVGATSEISLSMIEQLRYLGCNLILSYRNELKLKKLTSLNNDQHEKYLYLDLENENSINKFIDNIKSLSIDYCIMNSASIDVNADIVQINALKIIKLIKMIGIKTSYIVTSSISYCSKKSLNLEDKYAYSKRLLMKLSYELANEGFKIYLGHPGIIYTELFKKRHNKIKLLLPLIKHIIPSKDYGALCILNAINANILAGEWSTPRFFNVWGMPKIKKFKFDIIFK